MKRDMGIIRGVLLALESSGDLRQVCADDETLRYHIRLAIEGGLLRGNITEYAGGYHVLLNDCPITNVGHDFLDAIREDTIWRKVLTRISGVAGSVGVDMLAEIAKDELRRRLGLGNP